MINERDRMEGTQRIHAHTHKSRTHTDGYNHIHLLQAGIRASQPNNVITAMFKERQVVDLVIYYRLEIDLFSHIWELLKHTK